MHKNAYLTGDSSSLFLRVSEEKDQERTRKANWDGKVGQEWWGGYETEKKKKKSVSCYLCVSWPWTNEGLILHNKDSTSNVNGTVEIKSIWFSNWELLPLRLLISSTRIFFDLSGINVEKTSFILPLQLRWCKGSFPSLFLFYLPFFFNSLLCAQTHFREIITYT